MIRQLTIIKKTILWMALLCFTNIIYSQELSRLYDSALEKQQRKDYRGAIQTFSEIIKKSSYYYEAYLGRGQSYEAVKKYDSALVDYSQAIAKNPSYYQAYYYRASLYFNIKKDNSKALADVQKVMELNKNFHNAYLLRGDIFYAMGKLNESLKDYNQFIETKDNPSWELYYRRFLIHQGLDNHQDAIQDLKKVIALNAKYADAYYERGKLYQIAGEYTSALNDYEKAIGLRLASEDVWQRKADMLFELKQEKEALKAYSYLITNFRKKQSEWYAKRGLCYTFLGDSINAQKDFTKAITLNKNDYMVYVYRAENHIKRKRQSLALNDYAKAIQLSPKSWQIYLSRGKIYLEQTKYDEAIADFTLAIKYNATLGEAYFYRGACKDALKDVNGACEDLKKAAALHHQEAEKRLKRYCK